MALSTHADWLIACADRLVEAQRSESPELWKHYSNLAQQIAQSRATELVEFVDNYPQPKSLAFAPLMVLAWRIAAVESTDNVAQRARDAIMMLCDIDECEAATSAFSSKP